MEARDNETRARDRGLIATKLSVPPAPHALVPRGRLLARLDDACSRKLALVSAPAGSGKTTLLAAWAAACAARGMPAAWVALDERDNSPHRFWTYVIAALSRLGAEGEPAWLPQPGLSQASADALVEWVVETIISIPDDFFLILDDYHLIANPDVHRTLTYLLDHGPATMHVVLACREDPPLPLALLRARDQLVEVRAPDLNFTALEAEAFLREALRLDLPAEAAAALHARTEGWAAGLQLAGLSLRGRPDAPALAQSFGGSHRHVVDYLAEEVLLRQSPEVQRFLLETSILDRLSGPLCDAILEDQGGETARNPSSLILERLERANLFLIPLDNDRRWYRYHQLFADFLRERLRREEPARWAELHAAAALYLEREEHVSQAFEHWVKARSYGEAARLVAERAQDLLDQGEVQLLLDWTDQLPIPVRRARPAVAIYRAWALAIAGQAQQHACALEELDGLFAGLARPGASQTGTQDALISQAAAIRAYCAITAGEIARARELAQAALSQLPGELRFPRAAAHLVLGFGQWWQGELGPAEATLRAGARIDTPAGAHDRNMWEMVCLRNLGDLYRDLGRLHMAEDAFREALRASTGPDGQLLPLAAGPLSGLAWVLRQRNELPQALSCAEQALVLARRSGAHVSVARCLLALADVYDSIGQTERAQRSYEEMERLLAERLPRLRQIELAGDRLRWYVRRGDYGRAERLAGEAGASSDSPLVLNKSFAHISLARLLAAQGKAEEADRLIERLVRFAEAPRQERLLIETLMLQALSLAARGRRSQALQALCRSLSMAEPEGYIRLYLEEGEPMAALLIECKAWIKNTAGATGGPRLLPFIERLLSLFPNRPGSVHAGESAAPGARPAGPVARYPAAGRPSPAAGGPRKPPAPDLPGLLEPLSEREMQILRLIAAGKTYQEIARDLIVALSTVQSYIKNLYPKLDVHSGLEAVARARQLGLLA